MSRIRPLNDFVLLEKRIPAKSPGGTIHLPEKRRERSGHDDHADTIEARVLAVGPGDVHIALKIEKLASSAAGSPPRADRFVMPVKEGDIILVCENALHEVTHEGRTLYLCPARALFAVVEGN